MKHFEFLCNMCGKVMNRDDIQNNPEIDADLCYGSKHDGERVHIDLCCDCFDSFIDSLKVAPFAPANSDYIHEDEFWGD